MQLEPLQAQRLVRFQAFEATAAAAPPSPALGTVPPAFPPPTATVLGLLPDLWSLRWDNNIKEIYWRLIYNGLPTADHIANSPPCCCGQSTPDRLHHFWTCPVAAAVIQVIANKLSPPQRAFLSCSALWLAVPPPHIHRGVWYVVCLAAIAAMDSARRWQANPRLKQRPTLHSLTNFAIARFWDLLQDFCSCALPPMHWYPQHGLESAVPFGHPIISPYPNW